MTGQGESQPVGSVDALSDLAAALEPEKAEAPQPEESESEETAESEEVETEGEAESEEEAEEPTFTIEHDGKEVTLKQSELIELGQKGFDYSKKTMAVAEERKAVEAERARVSEARQKHDAARDETIARLEAVKKYMTEQVGTPPPVEWAATDAHYYLAQKELYEQRKGQLQQAEAGIAHLMQEKQRERQASLQQQANDTIAALKNTLPGWSDTSLAELEKYVQTHGLNPDNAEAGYVQKGLWELAHKAKAYDALMAQKAQIKPKAQLTRVDKPAAANPVGKAAERAKREAEFNKNPSVDALANLLR